MDARYVGSPGPSGPQGAAGASLGAMQQLLQSSLIAPGGPVGGLLPAPGSAGSQSQSQGYQNGGGAGVDQMPPPGTPIQGRNWQVFPPGTNDSYFFIFLLQFNASFILIGVHKFYQKSNIWHKSTFSLCLCLLVRAEYAVPPTVERVPGCTTVFIGGLSAGIVSEETVRDIFGRFGELEKTRLFALSAIHPAVFDNPKRQQQQWLMLKRNAMAGAGAGPGPGSSYAYALAKYTFIEGTLLDDD